MALPEVSERTSPVHFLDTRGLMCPLPLLRLKQALAGMSSGEMIEVLATDPAARLDFCVFLEQVGHHLLESGQDPKGDVLRFLIQKG